MDYEVQRPTRHCTVTGRELQPGEEFYSLLTVAGAATTRQDFAPEAWRGPPDGALGWWKSRVPSAETRKPQWAPNDVMLDLFEQLADQPDKQDLRYVLALLLVRRRVLRVEEGAEPTGDDHLIVYCPRREQEFQVAAVMPDQERAQQIQDELSKLLLTGG